MGVGARQLKRKSEPITVSSDNRSLSKPKAQNCGAENNCTLQAFASESSHALQQKIQPSRKTLPKLRSLGETRQTSTPQLSGFISDSDALPHRQFSLVACDSGQHGLVVPPAIAPVGTVPALRLSLQFPTSDRTKCEATGMNPARCQAAVVVTSSWELRDDHAEVSEICPTWTRPICTARVCSRGGSGRVPCLCDGGRTTCHKRRTL